MGIREQRNITFLTIIFFLDNLKILNKELQNINQMSKTRITSLVRYASEHLSDCNQAEPYFQIFPFYYETNTALREYKEKRYILIWKHTFDLNKT